MVSILANLFVKGAVGSDIGTSRSNNQDNYYLNGKFAEYSINIQTSTAFQSPVEDGVFAVFDGMGGQSKGEFASLCASKVLDNHKANILKYGIKQIHRFVNDANEKICDEMRKENERIGSTLAVLTVTDNIAQAYNLGDSSIYYISKNKITKLTRDHTVAEQMYRMNVLTKEEASHDVRKHRLTKHLGMFAEESDLRPYASANIRVNNGDMFLLCTDGITNSVNENEIKRIITTFDGRCKQTVNALIEKAIENGSQDNLTAMVLRIVNSTNSTTIRSQLRRHPRLYPFLLGVGISTLIFVSIIAVMLSRFT